MANILDYTNFVLDKAMNDAIQNFEGNVKGEFVCVTEKGIRIKILNKSSNKYTHYNVVPKSTKVVFENLNGNAAISFNNLTKDNVRYALVYYKQIVSIRHVQSIIRKFDSLELKREYIKKNDNLIDNSEYNNE